MQYARVNVTKHPVAQAVAIKQRAEFNDIVSQMLRRYTGIFGKWDRLSRPFSVAEQPDRFFTHRVNALNTIEFVATLPADNAAFMLSNQFVQSLAERTNLTFNQRFIITRELDDIQPQHLFIWNIGNQFTNRVPDNIFPGQIKDLRVDGFDRQRARFNHKRRVTQRRIKGVVFDIHQTTYLRQRRNIQPCFGNKGQRPLGARQHAG